MPKIDFVFDKFRDNIYAKDENTNLYKLLKSISEEFDTLIINTEKVKESHFVDNASIKDLEKIAEIISINRYPNESEIAFRGRIKTTIPSFVGGGTISSIQQVIKSFLGVNPTIIEHYKPGNGHAEFHSGVLSGINGNISGLNIELSAGTSYINGLRITSNEANLTVSINSTSYLKLGLNGNFKIDENAIITESEILLYKIESDGDNITSITDLRYILDPFNNYISNAASITIQIPYNFTENLISMEETKNILIKTKAAGIALLINVVGAYDETVNVQDAFDFSFNVGFSSIGSKNYIGGYGI